MCVLIFKPDFYLQRAFIPTLKIESTFITEFAERRYTDKRWFKNHKTFMLIKLKLNLIRQSIKKRGDNVDIGNELKKRLVHFCLFLCAPVVKKLTGHLC